MTYAWYPRGMARAVWHAFDAWRRDPGQELRYDAICGAGAGDPVCGGVGGDVSIDPDGRAICLECTRRLAAAGEGGQPAPA